MRHDFRQEPVRLITGSELTFASVVVMSACEAQVAGIGYCSLAV